MDWETSSEVLSTERAICCECGDEGWRGDFPAQGGIVHDQHGDLLCDECDDLRRRESDKATSCDCGNEGEHLVRHGTTDEHSWFCADCGIDS